MKIRLGHSPDPDDAFMFWGLAAGEVDTRGFEFEHVLAGHPDAERVGARGPARGDAISLHAYPFVQDRYLLLRTARAWARATGRSSSRASRSRTRSSREVEIAVPGRMTTAFLDAAAPARRLRVARGAVRPDHGRGRRRAAPTRGSLIHEGQLTYEAAGLQKVVDLGEWWLGETGLPLPLGVNVARRDLGPEVLRELSAVLADSIRAGLENRERALEYALQFGRGLDGELADRFVGMYVNELTQDYGEQGRRAVEELLRRGEEIGAFREPVRRRVRRLSRPARATFSWCCAARAPRRSRPPDHRCARSPRLRGADRRAGMERDSRRAAPRREPVRGSSRGLRRVARSSSARGGSAGALPGPADAQADAGAGSSPLVSARASSALRSVTVVPVPPPTSPLPGATAFRVCGGNAEPYLQYGLALGFGSAWVACRSQSEVQRIDRATGQIVAHIRLPGVSVWSVAAGEGAVWAISLRGSTVYRIDPLTNQVAAQIPLDAGVPYLWAGGGAVWAADDDGQGSAPHRSQAEPADRPRAGRGRPGRVRVRRVVRLDPQPP